MEDFARRGPRTEHHQWYSTSLTSSRVATNDEKDEARSSNGVVNLGTGALHFMRNRGSVRRQLKRDSSNRNKPSNEARSTTLTRVDGSSGGISNGVGGFGKWLRDHLGGGSRSNQEILPTIPSKKRSSNASYDLSFAGSDKNLIRTTYTPQNLYCSLPREQHRRHCHASISAKSSHEMIRERVRCFSGNGGMNFRERSGSSDLASITRGGPCYGSEGKSMRRRERERRRHSMNETRGQSRQHRMRPVLKEMEKILKILDDLKVEVERMMANASTSMKIKMDENRNSVTRMTKVKSERPRRMRPGRC